MNGRRRLAVRLSAVTKTGDSLVFDFTGSSESRARHRHQLHEMGVAWRAVCRRCSRCSAPTSPGTRASSGRSNMPVAPEGLNRELPSGNRRRCRCSDAVAAIRVESTTPPPPPSARCCSLRATAAASEQLLVIWHANHFAIFKFGPQPEGGHSIGILTGDLCRRRRARSFGDGVDIGGEIPNPISRMALLSPRDGGGQLPLPLPAPPPASWDFRRALATGAAAAAANSPLCRTRRAGRQHPLRDFRPRAPATR